jgi:hypothetical protein
MDHEPKAKSQDLKGKQRVVTFKVEEEMAAFLDDMPNKSEFIRKAILSALMEPCPVCQGKGSVPRSLRRDLETLFEKQQFVPCSYCGYEFPLDQEKARRGADDKMRLKQYLGGGEFYCNDCFSKTLACENCGEHVAETRMGNHMRRHGQRRRIIRHV